MNVEPSPRRRLHLDGAAEQVRKPLRKCQAEPRTAVTARRRAVALAELVEHVRAARRARCRCRSPVRDTRLGRWRAKLQTMISPRSVNFSALPSKLMRMRKIFFRSLRIVGSTVVGSSSRTSHQEPARHIEATASRSGWRGSNSSMNTSSSPRLSVVSSSRLSIRSSSRSLARLTCVRS